MKLFWQEKFLNVHDNGVFEVEIRNEAFFLEECLFEDIFEIFKSVES